MRVSASTASQLPSGFVDFINESLGYKQDLKVNDLQALSGDAGFRQYFRCQTTPPLLAVNAPPSTENSRQFVAIAEHLRASGVITPKVHASDFERGFLLVQDFGGQTLLDVLNDESADAFYQSAMAVLLDIQQAPCDDTIYPSYTTELLLAELDLFDEWFLRKSRNLMVLDDKSLAVLDFQDAVIGPWTYDLVSLLKDCYVKWPRERVQDWAWHYAQQAMARGLVSEHSEASFVRAFDLMGLQRHLKVLGIFCRLFLRDGKSGYLSDLPRVFAYVVEVTERYPECNAFSEVLAQLVEPLFREKAASL